MTNKEILEKAIQKAIDGGWDYTDFETFMWNEDASVKKKAQEIAEEALYRGDERQYFNVNDLIFNHDFAKALWPNKVHDGLERELWKGHLQNMVIAEDPIKYLGENI